MPPYIRPALHHPTPDLPYTSNLSYTTLGQAYPMPPYVRPALCHPTPDLPYASNLSYTALGQTYPMPPYVGDLPYAALCQWPT